MERNDMYINLGGRDRESLDKMLRASSGIRDTGQRIEMLSGQFLGVPYVESTLMGNASSKEVLVINLGGVDCFTFLDYVEAMRRSGSFDEFREQVRKVRYRDGEIAFKNRNHFFTDWREFNQSFAEDVTPHVGAGMARKTAKILNKKRDGSCFIQGIEPVRREIYYISSSDIGESVAGRMNTGDYIGIYSGEEGLDVSHAGILVRRNDSLYLRHASSSSACRQVVDQDFIQYISDRPGIVVLRPKGL